MAQLLMSVAAALSAPPQPYRQCYTAGNFITEAQSSITTFGEQKWTDVSIKGVLVTRPLVANETSRWLGFQLLAPKLSSNGTEATSPIYGLPIAAEINRFTHKIIGFHIPAKLKVEDADKLHAIVRTLHPQINTQVQHKPTQFSQYESDSLGDYEVKYHQLSLNGYEKEKRQYTPAKGKAKAFGFETPKILNDKFEFSTDSCWLTELTGNNHTKVSSESTMTIEVKQQIQYLRTAGKLPNAPLFALNNNPKNWPLIPKAVLYPKPPAKPLASAKLFLTAIKSVDLSKVDKEQLRQLLYDNDVYLMELRTLLKKGQLDFESQKKLMLSLGIHDSEQSHQLLTSLIVDQDVSQATRFQSLMALRYSETPLSAEQVETLITFATEDYGKDSGRLQRSTLLVLGFIVKNQPNSEFADMTINRMLQELNGDPTESETESWLLALGNTQSDVVINELGEFAGNTNPRIRERAAQALGNIPSHQSIKLIQQRLAVETNVNNSATLISALANQPMDSQQVDELMRFSQHNNKTLKKAAIKTLGAQSQNHPHLKPKLKGLIGKEKDQDNLRALMKAVYGDKQSGSQ